MVNDPTASAMLTARGCELEAPLALWDPLMTIASTLDRSCYTAIKLTEVLSITFTSCACARYHLCPPPSLWDNLIGQFQKCPVYNLTNDLESTYKQLAIHSMYISRTFYHGVLNAFVWNSVKSSGFEFECSGIVLECELEVIV